MQTSIRELKTHLSTYLHRVQAGEECVITSHHQPVAKIIPIQQTNNSRFATRQQLIVELREQLGTQIMSKTPTSQLIIKQRQLERY